MAVDFTKDEINIRLDLCNIWRKHQDLINDGKFPHDAHKDDPMYAIGAHRALRMLFVDILGDGDYGDA